MVAFIHSSECFYVFVAISCRSSFIYKELDFVVCVYEVLQSLYMSQGNLNLKLRLNYLLFFIFPVFRSCLEVNLMQVHFCYLILIISDCPLYCFSDIYIFVLFLFFLNTCIFQLFLLHVQPCV